MNRYLIYVMAGYLSGSVLYARVFLQLFGKSDEYLQSKDANPGTSNAFACGGFACGVLTLAGDMLKGWVPVWLFLRNGCPVTPMSLALVLLAPVAGHAFPCFYGLQGGKGIAVSFGCMLALVPNWAPVLLFAGCFVFFSVVIQITPHFQRTAITYFVTMLLEAFTHQDKGVVLGYALITGVVFLRLHMSHEPRERTQVLLAGKELPIEHSDSLLWHWRRP